MKKVWLAVIVLLACASCENKTVVQTPSGDMGIAGQARELPAASGEAKPRTVYVPAYSHVPVGKRMTQKSMLSVLLSVRNVDSTTPITLTQVEYFDTSGHLVRRYLKKPRTLRPLETAEFTVRSEDEVGGSGANFLVYWSGPSDAHALLTEAVMLGHIGASYISFTSRGVELDRRPDPDEFDDDDLAVDSPGADADAGDQTAE